MLARFLRHDLELLRQLSQPARALLLSFLALGTADPLLGLFLGAFLWRHMDGIYGVAAYQWMLYVGLVIAFYANKWLLHLVSIRLLHGGALAARCLPLVTIFCVANLSLSDVALLGLISGLFGGVYWGNRILLTIELTQKSFRTYFCSLEIAANVTLSVIVPLF